MDDSSAVAALSSVSPRSKKIQREVSRDFIIESQEFSERFFLFKLYHADFLKLVLPTNDPSQKADKQVGGGVELSSGWGRWPVPAAGWDQSLDAIS